jgi:hypothetical protein
MPLVRRVLEEPEQAREEKNRKSDGTDAMSFSLPPLKSAATASVAHCAVNRHGTRGGQQLSSFRLQYSLSQNCQGQ